MKALKLIIIGIMLFLASAVKAQVIVSANINAPPSWITVSNADVRYYYLPALETFYDIRTSMFIYHEGNGWIHKAILPERFSGYDLYCLQKIMITGYINFDEPKTKYIKGNHSKEQRLIAKNQGKWNLNKESSLVDNKSY